MLTESCHFLKCIGAVGIITFIAARTERLGFKRVDGIFAGQEIYIAAAESRTEFLIFAFRVKADYAFARFTDICEYQFEEIAFALTAVAENEDIGCCFILSSAVKVYKLYARFGITDSTDYSKMKPTDYPIMEDFYKLCEEEFMTYDSKRKYLYTEETLQEVCLGIHSMCVGAESKYFNGHTNITDDAFLVFGVKGLMDTNVYFEEQGIHSTDPGAEFYITIYGSIAQSESENISANVKWGKAQSAKDGKVSFHYKNFLGYRKGEDGNPEIDPEQAAIVRRIYERFLAGDSLATIADSLNADGIATPSGNGEWRRGRIASILTNEKYKGDAVLNKTYISDCLTKKVKINNGERPKYYVENNHPAIIDSATFGRVQEEMARRNGKRKTKQIGTKTEQGKYSSKYALTELLICGECGTPYRRCTWTNKGKKKIVWRCINRLDYGKKYCHESPSIEENLLQKAIMNAIMKTTKQNAEVLKTLKLHIGMGLDAEETEDKSFDIQIRIAEIDAEFKAMLQAVSAQTADTFDDSKATALINEKNKLLGQLEQISAAKQKRESAKSRLDEIYTIIDGLKNHPLTYDDQIIRQILECVIVESKDEIKVVFVGGIEVIQPLD